MGGKIYIISPVRHLTDRQAKLLRQHMWMLHEQGCDVHLPFLHTDQDVELGGMMQCMQNRKAIEEADEVHVMWTGKSQGGLFDLGMAFALRKPLKIIRCDDETVCSSIENYVPGEKTFENVMWAWEKGVY